MQAIVIRAPGGPEVLTVADVVLPEPSRDEVCVRIGAAGVNRVDLLQRQGLYPAPKGSPQDIPGMEFAGVVDAVGPDVLDVRMGERVFGLVGGGAYAEAVNVHSRALARIPDGLDDAHAATIPEAFLTAYDAVVTQANLRAGETLLVHAVGSGVGTAAVQLGRALGARVLGTARTQKKLDRARELGMDVAIAVENGQFANAVLENTRGQGADVVLDLVGGAYVRENLRCVALRGRILLVGLVDGRSTELDLALLLQRRASLVGTVLRARPLEERIALHQVLQRNLVPLFERGALRPVLDRVFPLKDAPAAHSRMAANENFGKVVLALR